MHPKFVQPPNLNLNHSQLPFRDTLQFLFDFSSLKVHPVLRNSISFEDDSVRLALQVTSDNLPDASSFSHITLVGIFHFFLKNCSCLTASGVGTAAYGWVCSFGLFSVSFRRNIGQIFPAVSILQIWAPTLWCGFVWNAHVLTRTYAEQGESRKGEDRCRAWITEEKRNIRQIWPG